MSSGAFTQSFARFHRIYVENYVCRPNEASCCVAVYSVYDQH
jgi:hypothetical protein